MKKINKLVIISMSMLMGACASSHIQLDDKKITQGYGDVIYKSRVNLTNINIYQKVYKMNNGSVLTYEDAIIGTGYKLSYGVNRMVDIIFPGFHTQKIHNKGNLYFLELKGTDKTLYLILNNINKKRYKLVYGYNQENFKELFTTVTNEKETVLQVKSAPVHIRNEAIINPELFIYSKWSEKNIIMDTILTKVGARPYR